jgi:virginiamycin B lyase
MDDRSPPTRIREFPVGPPGSGPYALTVGPDDALWITLVHAGQIARLWPDGRLDLYELDSATCRPSQVTTGPDGALWFTRPADDRIGRITTSGETTVFPVKAGSAPFGITAGCDDALWFTAMGTDQIARISTDGHVTEFPLPERGAMASMITAGPDGALWFTLNQAHAIGRMSTDGDIAIYPLPTPDAGPVGIAAAVDTIWFVEIVAGQVGCIGLDGTIREFALRDRAARPHAIVADSAGGCWLSQWGNSSVARVTGDGDLREIALPAGSEPHGLAIGSDGALWVALEAGSAARIEV